MKVFVVGLLILLSMSVFAEDCTVSISRFTARRSSIEAILISKGYTINNTNPTYEINSSTSLLSDDVVVVNIDVIKDGVRIHGTNERILVAYMFIGGVAAVEKKFIKSLPACE